MPTITEDFEDDTLDFAVTSGNWVRTTTLAFTGTYSYTNADIGDGGSSSVTFAVPEDATAITFWYLISSEGGYDYLRFYVDGAQLFAISGGSDWTQQGPYDLVGAETFGFSYTKDGSVSSGYDAAFIDNIVVSSSIPGPPPESFVLTPVGITNTAGTLPLSTARTSVLDPSGITNVEGPVGLQSLRTASYSWSSTISTWKLPERTFNYVDLGTLGMSNLVLPARTYAPAWAGGSVARTSGQIWPV